MATEVELQPLKENVETVEINEFLVKVGDIVEKGQPIVEVQADKSSLEVPSPESGKVVEFLVEPGDEVSIGQALLRIEPEDANGSPSKPKEEKDEADEPDEDEQSKDEQSKDEDGEKTESPRDEKPTKKDEPESVEPPGDAGDAVRAGPATRRLARELGVDLRQVKGTARNGRITEDDVRTFVKQLASAGVAAPGGSVSAPPLPDFSKWGDIEEQPLRGIRKATARQMSLAWSLIPHVTQHDEADITELEAFRLEQKQKKVRITVSAYALKAAVVALREFPRFNSSFDAESGKLILKKYFHIGVAVDTDNGLLVPVLRDVDRKSVHELGNELAEVAERAREGKLDSEELQGGCFTLTNLGGIGGTAFTPIVNYPEVAILGLSRGRKQPALHDGGLVERMVLPLSLSYDHRVIDGADAARFARRVAELLESPALLSLHI